MTDNEKTPSPHPRRPAIRAGAVAGSSLLLLALASGCATVPRPDPGDPFESFNRTMFEFNETLDRAVLKPVATTYVDWVPSPVRRGVNNFFGNLRDAWSFVNNTLQAKPTGAADSALRFGVNTVFGLGGVLDVAGEMRIPKHTEDFGQTLGYWGVRPGPYLVLPFLGPSTVRDTAALPVDYAGDLARLVDPAGLRYSLYGLRIVDTRANLLRTTSLLSDVALDKYTFSRDAYLQLRRTAVGVGADSGEGRLQRGRGWVHDLTNRSGSPGAASSDDAEAGKEPDYTQPPGAGSPDDAGKAPDYTRPAEEGDDAGKAPDYTKP